MSDVWGGAGWWMATDGRWYPPEVSKSSVNGEAGEFSEFNVRVGPESASDTIDRPALIELSEFDLRVGDIEDPAAPIDLTAQERDDENESVLAGGTEPKPGTLREQAVGYEQDTDTARSPRFSLAPAEPLSSQSKGSEDIGQLALTSDSDEPPAPNTQTGVVLTPLPKGSRSRSGPILLALATILAVAAGVLGALWVRQRDEVSKLEVELAAADQVDLDTNAQIEGLENEIGTLEARNAELARELGELRPLVADVPRGRMSDIAVPFAPAFVDEVRGRLIAVDSDGSYLIWGDGINAEVTDSGSIEGTPTGLIAIVDEAFVATSTGAVEIISLSGADDRQPIQSGVIEYLAQDRRGFWAFSADSSELRRYRVKTGKITTSVALPTAVRDITEGAGAVWALGADGLVYRINTADFTLSPFEAGEEVVALAAGPDALWALSAADGSLRRLDAVSGDILVTVPLGRDPIDAVFSGSSVWVILRSGETLIEVDTRTSAVVSRTRLPGVPVSLSPGDKGVLVTLEGDVPIVRVSSIEDPG